MGHLVTMGGLTPTDEGLATAADEKLLSSFAEFLNLDVAAGAASLDTVKTYLSQVQQYLRWCCGCSCAAAVLCCGGVLVAAVLQRCCCGGCGAVGLPWCAKECAAVVVAVAVGAAVLWLCCGGGGSFNNNNPFFPQSPSRFRGWGDCKAYAVSTCVRFFNYSACCQSFPSSFSYPSTNTFS